MGRLVRTLSPWPSPEVASAGYVRGERFYYDGSRRVQEVVVDPIDTQAAGGIKVIGRVYRTIENYLIKRGTHLDNQSQSMAHNHRFARWAEEWAESAVKQFGIKIP